MKKIIGFILSIILVLGYLPQLSHAEKRNENVALWNAIKPLETTVTFLNTGAHPDDERSDLLAYLSRGLGVKTASLIANRGEGGQNEIGNELGNGLGIIRTYEMKEAAKITGVKAYHLSQTTSDPIYDFGFSKTPEETLSKWGEEVVYERLIRFIRTYKPDIIMPSFRNDNTQHGHHRTMTILTEKAFADAADPTVFPQQLKEGLTAWQVKKLYLSAESKEKATTSLEIGMLDSIYGMTYPQLGEESRFLHKSQGMGSKIPAEPRQVYLELEKSNGAGTNDTLFKGVPYNLSEWANELPAAQKHLKSKLQQLQKQYNQIITSYHNEKKILPLTHQSLRDTVALKNTIAKASLNSSLKANLLSKLSIKEQQLSEVSAVASQVDVAVKLDHLLLNRGKKETAAITIKNKGEVKLKDVSVRLNVPKGWKQPTSKKQGDVAFGKEKKVQFTVEVPTTATYYHPYEESAISATVTYSINGTKNSYSYPVDGTVAVLPEASVQVLPESMMLNTVNPANSFIVDVKAKNYTTGRNEGTITLEVPKGWGIEPRQQKVAFNKQLEEKQVRFTVYPPKDVKEGTVSIHAAMNMNGQKQTAYVQEIKYDHIGTRYYVQNSSSKVEAFPLKKPQNIKIGYIDSGFDKVAEHLQQAGLNVVKLTEKDLTAPILQQYDTIVVGIRAYLSRADLLANNAALLAYVQNGGHVVMQYHKPADKWDTAKSAPYALKIGNPSIDYRVTDENAKVTVLQPESSLFHFPNQITDKDWSGWIQERGLYFPMEWDAHYQSVVRMNDPNEAPFDSGILVADYGKGTYIYTSLVFYRQIQEQVPGAYRIFTNLLSYKTE
ncbi:PIG-L family deacetylase [Bacillus sp. 1P06AnD]|uniref:PIG-L family deacetylase n=1 Tax=Bacillus sp. 1P06AnD TaxID=3132208 RepID=UPI0039A2E75C